MAVPQRTKRPLSPHLQVYKPQMTTLLSILHRMTGVALSLGLVLLCLWLWAAAYHPSSLSLVYGFTHSLAGIMFLIGWSIAFYYHLANGIRHLVWDTGHMLEIDSAYKAGYGVLGFTFGATLGTWAYIAMELWS